MMEAVRIRKEAFAQRYSHASFGARYASLLPAGRSTILPSAPNPQPLSPLSTNCAEDAVGATAKQAELASRDAARALTETLASALGHSPDSWQVGLTKVFLRAP